MLDYKTTNDSALKMYQILKDLGINNNAIHLQLYDETLLGIDPLNESNLTNDQKIRIHNEITKNPWYFLRNIVRIPSGGGNSQFEFTRGTLAITYAILNDISSFVILPRQCYKTYTVATIYCWLFYWGCKNTDFMLFSYRDDQVSENLSRIKEVRDTLPAYLNLYDYKRGDKDNTREMLFEMGEYSNHIRIKSPANTTDGASKAGRGFTVPILWIDEINFVKRIKDVYESSVFAYKTAAQIAKRNRSHYHRVLTSSAGHLNSDDGKWAFKFIQSCCEFTEKMYDYDINTVQEMINKNSTNGFLHIEYMYYDLGKADNYLEEMKKDSVSDDAFRREVLNSWEEVDTEHPLGQELVTLISSYIHKPEDIIVIDKVYFLKLYKKIGDIDFSKRYVAGIDCGGNVMRDFSTFVLTDPETFEVIGVLRTNSFSTTRFAKAIGYILLKVFPNTVIVPERNNMGIAVIDCILDTFPQLKSRIYYDENNKPGFTTTKQVRSLLLNTLLKVSVSEDYDKIHDRNIISEIIGLKRTRSGRIDHDPNSGHDDTLMGYLFTRWFYTYAPNRTKYIDTSLIGRLIPKDPIELENEIELLTKGAQMKNYKHLLLNQDEGKINIMNSDGTFNDNLRNPRNQDKLYDILLKNRSVGESVTDAMELINTRLQDRFKPKTQDIEKLNEKDINEEELYDKSIDDVRHRTNQMNTEEINIFRSSNLGAIKIREAEENTNKKDLYKKILFG